MVQNDIYGIANRDLVVIERKDEPNFDFSVGLRKLARFSYEEKGKKFYDGTETSMSEESNVGPVGGFEYLFEYSDRRLTGREAINQRYYVRYVANFWIIEADFLENGLADVMFLDNSLKLRAKLGNKFNLTGGISSRVHPAYGVDPIQDYLSERPWFALCYDYGFSDEYWYNDANNDGEFTPGEYSSYNWFSPSGQKIATSDEEFRQYHLSPIVNRYNAEVRDTLPMQSQISAIIGLDYYHYEKDMWLHAYANVMPWHKEYGKYEYSYERLNKGNWVDYSGGVVFGTKIGKKKRFGMFAEGQYNNYWGREWFDYKMGINITLR